ncbi:metallophosphoesterase family protein [Sphingomonas bacterium]|uniref:metallophosphoesterase family protein n=1 Tax=Sphingomonas bacterium TaxID=1895847 RepID=UPI00157578B4|nr:metallophosphoesterase family protein [Sphingomonas bacterium]
MLRKLFRSRPSPSLHVPARTRVYAVGDIHGRLDLLETLLTAIDADEDARGAADTVLIFLGDVLDRGPDSAAVVDRLLRLSRERASRFLLGNHEQMFLAALAGNRRSLHGFCRMGGRETVLSYGIEPAAYERMDYDELGAALLAAVPAAHRRFLETFEDMVVVGDYAFVHAGVDPRVPLDAQEWSEMRWMRDPFLNHRAPLEKMIVHGHTMTEAVEWRSHRIGIDTGAYATNVLTALGLESADRWVVDTR